MTERILHSTFVSIFRSIYPNFQLILSLSGTSLAGSAKQKSLTINEWKQQGWERGLPDLTIALPRSVTIHLELKRPGGGKQSTEQVAVQAKLTRLGHHYYVVDDIMDMFAIIADHTNPADRQFEFTQFTASLSHPVLTTEFLYFPVGTLTQSVLDAIRPYYHLNGTAI